VSNVDLNRLKDSARPWLVALVVTFAVALASVITEPDVRAAGEAPPRTPAERQTAGGSKPPSFSLRPFRGFGAWIDIYDTDEWDNPEAAVRKMDQKGVQTLFLETANYRIKTAIYRRSRVSRFIEASVDRGIDIVAWYLPDFQNLERDFNRSKAALRFKSENGFRFDGFALDIEATAVRDIDKRNRRMFRLTRQIKNANDAGMKLGAITPDPIGSLYWPDFPYSKVGARYDVVMPMGYFTFRTSGANGVRKHVEAGVVDLRKRIDRGGRIHYIGGLAGDAKFHETRAYRRVALEKNIMGGGLYDFATTKRSHWKTLRPLRRLAN
jgi:hypothetical protein